MRIIFLLLFCVQLNAQITVKGRRPIIYQSFTYTLASSATTSAGIYDSANNLVRTLWSGEYKNAGTYTIKWDGTDDTLATVAPGTYSAKVLSNNVIYDWEGGRIGNTSDSMTGSTRYHGLLFIHTMAIAGTKAYCGTAYNEGLTSELRFNLSTPNQKTFILPGAGQATYKNATDGVSIFWAGTDEWANTKHYVFASNISDDLEKTFSSGSPYNSPVGRQYTSVIDLVTNANGKPTGMAIVGNLLFVSHGAMNEIHVLSKTTGALVATITTFTNPKDLSAAGSGNIWVSSGTSTVAKYSVNSSTGALTALGISISGLSNPLALSVSYDSAQVLVCDGGTSQQLKAYANSSGTSSWTLGTAGGYANSPDVNNNKFYFNDSTADVRSTFIAFQSDGSFWVGDPGNYRMQHYDASRNFIDRVMFLPKVYSSQVCKNDSTRVFGEYLEFAIDYSKILDNGTNGSWTLVKNWRGKINTTYYAEAKFEIFSFVTKFSNGRTYAFVRNYVTGNKELVELTTTGVRYTGIVFNVETIYSLHADGSLHSTSLYNGAGNALVINRQPLTGFDGSNNPTWGTAVAMVNVPTITTKDPFLGGPYVFSTGEITSGNIVASFSANIPTGGSAGYHLGGIALGGTKFKWKTAYSTHTTYYGDFPSDGSFDIGNSVVNAGNQALAIDRSIIWGYNGEIWKGTQVNKWNHVYENGLFVGQFGITGPEVAGIDGPAKMAGNSFSPALVKIGADYYLYHNDESYHSGVHRWKISNIGSIRVDSIPLTSTFVQSSELPALPGIDLMAGLPFASTLANNTASWVRNPTTDNTTNITTGPYWTIATGAKTYNTRKDNDIEIKYNSVTLSSPYTLSRPLGSNTGLTNWELYGKIGYDGDTYTLSTTNYLEVLDNTGKIIVRFFVDVTFGSGVFTLYIKSNGVTIFTDTQSNLSGILSKLQNISIKKTGGALTCTYANYSPVTISAFDGTSVIGNPTTMRLYFEYTGGVQYLRIVDISDFRFVNN